MFPIEIFLMIVWKIIDGEYRYQFVVLVYDIPFKQVLHFINLSKTEVARWTVTAEQRILPEDTLGLESLI